jgi:TRAP-type C4-dicarboxylate transport system permease small subunit
MLVMGAVCLRYLRERQDRTSESFIKTYVLLFGLLLLALGMSMAAMVDRYRVIGLYLAVFIVTIGGSIMLAFPGWFRSLLALIIEILTPSRARIVALLNAILCFFCAGALIYLSVW